MEEAAAAAVDYQNGDSEPVRNFKQLSNMFWLETVKMWQIAGPIALATLCQYGVNSFTNIFVGHIGDLELSAVSVSLTVICIFSFGFMLGMGSALETLCGQAYGAGKLELLGVYMQRSWLILTVSCFILLPVYIFASPILKLLGQQDEIAELAGKFTLLVIPQLFSLAVSFPTSKFLQAQCKVGVLTWISVFGLGIHVLLLWLFIFVFNWGTTGAAVAYDLSSWGIAIAQLVYVFVWCRDGWKGFSWLAFKDIWAFVRLSIASAVMLCLEVWYMMSIIILTGHLNNAVVAVDSISIW